MLRALQKKGLRSLKTLFIRLLQVFYLRLQSERATQTESYCSEHTTAKKDYIKLKNFIPPTQSRLPGAQQERPRSPWQRLNGAHACTQPGAGAKSVQKAAIHRHNMNKGGRSGGPLR